MPEISTNGEPGIVIASRVPGFTRETCALFSNRPNSKNKRSIERIHPIWRNFFYDHNTKWSRCVIGQCNWAVKSKNAADSILHLCEHHQTEHDNLPELMSNYLSIRENNYSEVMPICRYCNKATKDLTDNEINSIYNFVHARTHPTESNDQPTSIKIETIRKIVNNVNVIINKSTTSKPKKTSTKGTQTSSEGVGLREERQHSTNRKFKRPHSQAAKNVNFKKSKSSNSSNLLVVGSVENHFNFVCNKEVHSSNNDTEEADQSSPERENSRSPSIILEDESENEDTEGNLFEDNKSEEFEDKLFDDNKSDASSEKSGQQSICELDSTSENELEFDEGLNDNATSTVPTEYQKKRELCSTIKSAIKKRLESFYSFTLFVNIWKTLNDVIGAFVSVGKYSFKTHSFEIIYLDVCLNDITSPNLPSLIESNVEEILTDFGLVDTTRINETIIEHSRGLNYLCSDLKFKTKRPSYLQNLENLLPMLCNVENEQTRSRSESEAIEYIERLIYSDFKKCEESFPSTDHVFYFIKELEKVFVEKLADNPLYLESFYRVFGFMLKRVDNQFCSDFVISAYLNPKLKCCLDNSNLGKNELRSFISRFSNSEIMMTELNIWEMTLEVRKLLGLSIISSDDSSLSGENFNPIIYWQNKKEQYPNLSILACYLLTRPTCNTQKHLCGVYKWIEENYSNTDLDQADFLEGLKIQSTIVLNEEIC